MIAVLVDGKGAAKDRVKFNMNTPNIVNRASPAKLYYYEPTIDGRSREQVKAVDMKTRETTTVSRYDKDYLTQLYGSTLITAMLQTTLFKSILGDPKT